MKEEEDAGSSLATGDWTFDLLAATSIHIELRRTQQ
jgi:hypothetical protein